MFEIVSDFHVETSTGDRPNAENPQYRPAILHNERRSHAVELAAEMEARKALSLRVDRQVERLSRLSGIGFFVLSLCGVGWTIVNMI